jgi:hypothetical protein
VTPRPTVVHRVGSSLSHHSSKSPIAALHLEFSGGKACDIEESLRGATMEITCGTRSVFPPSLLLYSVLLIFPFPLLFLSLSSSCPSPLSRFPLLIHLLLCCASALPPVCGAGMGSRISLKTEPVTTCLRSVLSSYLSVSPIPSLLCFALPSHSYSPL